jgi:hypothetical protein
VALLVAGGAAEVLPVSLNRPLPLRRTHPLTLVFLFLRFCSDGSNQYKIWAAEVVQTALAYRPFYRFALSDCVGGVAGSVL